MQLTYNDIEPLINDGMTDTSAMADVLVTSGVSNQPINRVQLMYDLNVRSMLTKVIGNDSDEKWTGTILTMQEAVIAAVDAGLLPQVHLDNLRIWLSHITNPTNSTWDTTKEENASALYTMRAEFAGKPDMPTVEDFEHLYTLGDGEKYAGITGADVQAVIDQKAADDAKLAEEAAQAAKDNAVNGVYALAEEKLRAAHVLALNGDADALARLQSVADWS